ncbi:MAG: ABC transporter permease [Nitrospirae bacterium]|nr:ABC transporter permease [Nitrospirota bacterium]
MTSFVRVLGRGGLDFLRGLGKRGIFLFNAIHYSVTPPYKWRLAWRQVWFIGYMSLGVIVMTGGFTGMVLALQLYYTLKKFGAESMIGPGVASSLVRELGPVFTALMVTARGGSAITAELGIMRISEQIDSYYVMALNPYKYVVVPNFVAAIVCFPLLTAVFNTVGIWGGYMVAVKLLGVGSGVYFGEMQTFVSARDIWLGVYKSLSFAVIVSWVSCYEGFYVGADSSGFGAKAVSRATTASVVTASVSILVWDYTLGSFFV